MTTTFRFKRSTCHAPYDVEVSLDASESERFEVIFEAKLESFVREAIEIGIRQAMESEHHCPMRFIVLAATDLSGGTPQAGYKFCAEYAANELLGFGNKNPIGVPGGT
jgi:hypothetical protein